MIDAVLLVWIWRSLRLLVEKLKEQNTMHPHARLTSCMERGEGRYVIVQAHKCLCCCCCSAAKSCLTLWPMNFSTSGLPVPHHLPEFAQVHVHWNGDATQPSHPLLPSSPFPFNLSQHQGLLYMEVCVYIYIPMLLSHFVLPSPSLTVSTNPFSMSSSLFLPCK